MLIESRSNSHEISRRLLLTQSAPKHTANRHQQMSADPSEDPVPTDLPNCNAFLDLEWKKPHWRTKVTEISKTIRRLKWVGE